MKYAKLKKHLATSGYAKNKQSNSNQTPQGVFFRPKILKTKSQNQKPKVNTASQRTGQAYRNAEA